MADIPNSIAFTGLIAPTSTTDRFPVTNPKYGLGGLRTVQALTGSDENLYDIPVERRELGMLAYVVDVDKFYILKDNIPNDLSNNGNWEVAEFSGPTGPTGPPVSFTFDTDFPESANVGDYFLGSSGASPSIEGSLFIYANLTGPPDSDPHWFEISGVKGDDGDPGVGYTNAEIRDYILYLTKVESNGQTSEVELGYVGPTGNAFIFDADISANFGPDGRFGKYQYRDTIPAQGKTAVEVIKDALLANIPPTISVNISSPSSIDFGQTGISNTISYSYTIETQDAGLSSEQLFFKKSSDSNWTELDITNSSGSTTHNFIIPDNERFDITNFQYKYEVTDTEGSFSSAIDTINYDSYQSPTIIFNQYRVNSSGINGETTTKREKGNTVTKLAGSDSNSNITVSSNETFVDLISWDIQYADNSSLNNWTSLTSGDFPTNPTTFTHNPSYPSSNKIRYRMKVVDEYQTNYNNLSTINFLGAIFYGATSSVPSTSESIRNLDSNQFVDGDNPFILNTGEEDYTVFVAAFPDNIETEGIFDLNALNASLLGEYELSEGLTQVPDYDGTPKNYNVYINTIDSPYTDGNHAHEIEYSGSDVS